MLRGRATPAHLGKDLLGLKKLRANRKPRHSGMDSEASAAESCVYDFLDQFILARKELSSPSPRNWAAAIASYIKWV